MLCNVLREFDNKWEYYFINIGNEKWMDLCELDRIGQRKEKLAGTLAYCEAGSAIEAGLSERV